MHNIVMLLSNAFRPDMRVLKEAESLAEAGYMVSIICWDRRREFPEEEILRSGVRVIRIHSVPTNYGAGLQQILRTPRFWSAAIQKALQVKPSLVHCHDLDTLYAGVQIKKRLRCKLVYDAHEDYPALMSLYLPRFCVPLLNLFERNLLHQVDATLAASSVFLEKLGTARNIPSAYLPNVPDLAAFDRISAHQFTLARQELGLEENAYVVSYIGGFSRNRLLLPLIEAVTGLPEVTLLLWGDGHQRSAVEEAIRGKTNIRYLGWLQADLVPLYTCMSDAVYYCLRPDYPGAIFNAPNTLSNAMAARRPVIANYIGDLGRIVRDTGCGILLDEISPQTIRKAILTLGEPSIRRKLGEAGRAAAEGEFNWQAIAQRLLDIYRILLGQSA